MTLDDSSGTCRYLLHDNDACLRPLDKVLAAEKLEIIHTLPATPACNAFAERFVREARETLDAISIIGGNHLLKCIEHHHKCTSYYPTMVSC
jgi:hypothetical protein